MRVEGWELGKSIARKDALDGGDILRRIDADRGVLCEHHADLRAVFERAELLERFGLLEDARLPFHKLEQELRRVAVDALVAVELRAHTVIAHVGNERAGE